MTIKPEYLGDGVYASFDGFQIWLGLSAGEHLIALEPSVMNSLKVYEAKIILAFREEARRKGEHLEGGEAP